MSVLIKSNNEAISFIGTSKMLGTTAQIEFDKYKARVIADGGFIKDEARTLKAFNLLFSSKMYGNMNCAVSGTFGVKQDASGGIVKLYSIDGGDLVGVTFGSGVLPSLDAANNISFAANDPAQTVNGGLFTTTSKVVTSKVGNFGFATRMVDYGDRLSRRLAALTKHTDVANTVVIADLYTSSGDVSLSMHADPLSMTSANESSVIRVSIDGYNQPMLSFLTMPSISQKFGNRSGSEVTAPTGKTFMEITKEDFYIDFGGAIKSNIKYFSKATIKDFFCFSQATRAQATVLSTFS